LKDYCEQHGATVLISSHNLQHTIDISTRIILMEHGKLIKDLPNENGSAENELEAYFNL
jgi:ABC-2 type transport system ATP-binding protein